MEDKLSIVIPTYQRTADLAECLRSIREKSAGVCEVIVLCPEPEPDLREVCDRYRAALYDDGSRLDGRRVKSLWAIINQGIEIASRPFVCWLNDDCRVNESWDAIALGYFQPDVGIVVMKAKGINQNPDYHIGPGYYGVPVANYGVLRKSSGIRFDERFSWFYGDADISLQMATNTDLRVVGTTEGLVAHEHRADEIRRLNENDPRAARDRRYFDRKWSYKKRVGNRIVNMNVVEMVGAFAAGAARAAWHALKR